MIMTSSDLKGSGDGEGGRHGVLKELLNERKKRNDYASNPAGTQVENEPAAYKGKKEITPILGSFVAPTELCPSLKWLI